MSVDPQQACLYRAEVMHQRMRDARYRFRYRVFSLMLDIDRIDEAVASVRFLSFNRFNLLSFHARDHLPEGAASLRSWAETLLAGQHVDTAGLRIRLLCFPRVLGWVFNPLSLWYCEAPDGRPRAVIAEVRNTFGERHWYVLRPRDEAVDWPLCDTHAKDFHVSPFIGMQARYDFRLSRPTERLAVVIREFQDERLLLVATQTGHRFPLRDRNLLREVLRVPLQSLKVVVAIHWQALKIWIQGAAFHRKPPPPVEEVS